MKEAGQLALDHQLEAKLKGKKEDNSEVTTGDLLVHKFLINKMEKLFPHHQIISEEGELKAYDNDRPAVLIDPIDGSYDYLAKGNNWTIMVSIIFKGRPVEGYIYQPSSFKFYYGNGKESKVEIVDTWYSLDSHCTNESLVGVTSPSTEEEDLKDFDILGVTEVKKIPTASSKFLEVISGNADLYLNHQRKCHIWDLAAPAVLLEGSGGHLVLPRGFSWDYNKTHLNSIYGAVGGRFKPRLEMVKGLLTEVKFVK